MSLKACVMCQEHLDIDEFPNLSCKDDVCWSCLRDYIKSNLAPKLRCPHCKKINIDDVNMRKALDDEYIQKYEELCFSSIPEKSDKLVKCLMERCCYRVSLYGPETFECPICKIFNCISCRGIHPIMSCGEYKMKKNSTDISQCNEVMAMEEEEKSKARILLERYEADKLVKLLDELEQTDLITNKSFFNCSICFKQVAKGDGAMVKKCKHQICKSCLINAIDSNDHIPVLCPYDGCEAKLEDREIKALLNNEQYEQFQTKVIKATELACENVFHCKTTDCKNFVILGSKNVYFFDCDVCKKRNCCKCFTIHENGQSCDDYEIDQNTIVIQDKIEKGLLMKCPKCDNIIDKGKGCNLVQCNYCKLEICWVLKIPRWGPNGRGDTTGGCKCLVNGIKCSPKCEFGCMPD